jgi:hypothetical protein
MEPYHVPVLEVVPTLSLLLATTPHANELLSEWGYEQTEAFVHTAVPFTCKSCPIFIYADALSVPEVAVKVAFVFLTCKQPQYA